MFWTAGLVLVALAFGQVPAEVAQPVFIEDALAGAAGVSSDVSTASNRILSGWEAYPGQHPHQVSLRLVDANGGVSGCGGSVVHRNWVISAAHCTALRVTVVVRAGVTSLIRPEYIFESTEYWNHPSYDNNRPLVVQPNDVAIVKLARPVTYSKLLQPIRIQPSAEASANYDNEVVIASGWGRLWTEGAQPEVLNWVYLRAISNLACAQTFGTALINNNAICARWYNVTSQSTCQGDSGGPLVHVNPDGVPVLVGIASFVAGGDWGCHSGLPAGFIRPGPFLGWFKEITGIDFENFEEEDVTETPTTAAPTPTVTITPPPTETPTTSPTVPTPPPTDPPPSPEPEPEPEESAEDSDEDSDSGSEEDPEISELLKKLIVKVKVKVKVNNHVKRKIKVKCVDKI